MDNTTNNAKFKCERCGYATKDRGNLIKHQKRKVQCVALTQPTLTPAPTPVPTPTPLPTTTPAPKSEYVCEKCGKVYKSYGGHYNHQKKCMVHIAAFGEENIDYIHTGFLASLLASKQEFILPLITAIHLNPKYLMNRNVYIKDEHGYMYDGTRFVQVSMDEFLTKVIYQSQVLVEDHYTDYDLDESTEEYIEKTTEALRRKGIMAHHDLVNKVTTLLRGSNLT